METIGFIGLGTIGGVIAVNLLKAGYMVVGHDIDRDAVQNLVRQGGESSSTPSAVAKRCRIVLSSLPGPREVEAVALGPDGLVHGIGETSIYIDLSSSSADLIERIAAQFREVGGQAMDAPLIVGKNRIANRSVMVLASGAEETFAAVKPVFDAFSDTVVYAGALGTGTKIKLAHNLVRRGIGLAIGEGLVLGAKAGVEPELLWDCMHWGLEVQLQQLKKTLPDKVFTGDFASPADFGIGLSRKDVGLATELARRLNVPMPIAALVEQTMIQAMGRGWAEQSTLSLFRLQEEAAGVAVRKTAD